MLAIERPSIFIGDLLRTWRAARGKSQLSLATEAGISTRHLSFIETGRANPSRETVLLLAKTLDVPLRERNALLLAAGFAALYPETPFEAPALDEIRGTLQQILTASEPNPAYIINRRYDILLANPGALRLIAYFAPDWQGRANLAELLFAPRGLRSSLANWAELSALIAQRIRREFAASSTLDEADQTLLRTAIAVASELQCARDPSPSTLPIIATVKLRRGDVALDLFTTITTLGTPFDVTLQELRLETMCPTDAQSRAVLTRLAAP